MVLTVAHIHYNQEHSSQLDLLRHNYESESMACK